MSPKTGSARPRVFVGLIWKEWLANRNIVMFFAVVWLLGLPVLELFFHPGFILALGLIYAFWAAPRFAGLEVMEGSEEFSFSLPATRSQRYLAKLTVGGVPLLLMTVVGVLAIALDWPQMLWGLAVQSGFTRPFPAVVPNERFIYYIAVALPLATFAFAFVTAATARSATTAYASGFLGLVETGVTFGLCCLAEDHLLGKVNGAISTPVLLALSICALALGHFFYTRKEGISRPAPMRQGRWLIWVLVAVAAFLLLTAFFGYASLPSVRMAPRSPDASHLRQSTYPAAPETACSANEGEADESPATQPSTAPAERSH
jgi:hypothetical protein